MPKTRRERLVRLWRRGAPVFFVLGFALDAWLLRRIDAVGTLLQQGVYVLLLGFLLSWRRNEGRLATLRPQAIHFLFGALLNAFLIYGVRAAEMSRVLPWVFPVLLAALVLLNEWPRFRSLGELARAPLFGVAVTGYLAYLIPILAGDIEPWMFPCGAVVALAATAAVFWPQRAPFWAGAAVQAVMLGLYALGALPPLPLSLREVGVFHDVRREGARTVLLEVPGENESPRRVATPPGERVWVWARIVAPRHFRDRIVVRWRRAGSSDVETDAIPLELRYAGEAGWSGGTWKRNHVPGDWRVDIETEDGRLIGSIAFSLEHLPAGALLETRERVR